VKAGVGFARVELSHGADEIRSTGPGVLLGVGYDILLKNSFAATPFVHAMQLLVGSKSGMLDGVADSSPANPRVLHLGVALTELAAAGVSPASGGARWLE
jgi:hypothetical protein